MKNYIQKWKVMLPVFSNSNNLSAKSPFWDTSLLRTSELKAKSNENKKSTITWKLIASILTMISISKKGKDPLWNLSSSSIKTKIKTQISTINMTGRAPLNFMPSLMPWYSNWLMFTSNSLLTLKKKSNNSFLICSKFHQCMVKLTVFHASTTQNKDTRNSKRSR